MTTVLRIYHGETLTEYDLSEEKELVLGGNRKNEVLLPDIELVKGALRFKRTSDGWQYVSQMPMLGTEKAGAVELRKIYALQGTALAFVVYQYDDDETQQISIANQTEVLIGRSKECQLALDSKKISRKHARLLKRGGNWMIQDLESANGTYVNDKRVREAVLHTGDRIDIGLCRMLLMEDQISVRFYGQVTCTLTNHERARPYVEGAGYPCLFKRSPRMKKDVERSTVEIQAAPGIGAKPSINWLSVLLPPVCTIGIMGAMVLLMGFSPTTLLFSGPMTLVGVLMTVLNYRGQKKKHTQTERQRLLQYDQYLKDCIEDIEQRQAEMRQTLLHNHPHTVDCLPIVSDMERRLWERGCYDEDFLTLRLGAGPLPSPVEVQIPKEVLTLDKDVLSKFPAEIEKEHRAVEECPITLDLLRDVTAGVIGQRATVLDLVRNLVVQLATHHSYDEVKLITLCSKDEWKQWEFVRWLPHSFDQTRTTRYIANDKNSAERMLTALEDELQQRARTAAENDGHVLRPQMPYLLFLCADQKLVEHRPLLKELVRNDPNLGAGALFLFDRLENLPKECTTIVEVKGNKGTVCPRENVKNTRAFVVDVVPQDVYDRLARAMAPIRLERASGWTLPVSLSFLQGYGVHKPEQLKVEQNWSDAAPDRSMAVPVGVRASGEPFLFDIHEKQHGPHGLVAGMTGSGKSEMIQSWILSMALRFPPQLVSFVLIDFKGTGLILPFRNLPHLAGTISDLDTSIGRNLIALENELSRRKAMLDRYEVNNIAAYQKLYRMGKVREPLSYLFVVIDEFAEFKVQFPDFMQVVNRIFAIGRTLGVHIVLLTQKPANVVDDKMNANTRFRWCLKVASSADSKDMLGHPDAVKLTNPGRAFVQVGEDEIFEEIQSYWSGAPYDPNPTRNRQNLAKVAVVDLQGKRISYEPERTTGFRAERNEIDVVVDHLDRFVRENNLQRARSIWTQKLADTLFLNQVMSVAFDGERWSKGDSPLRATVGMVDDPRSQAQSPLWLELQNTGHVAVLGAPGTGKTTLLQTVVMSLCLAHSPEEVQLYLMDFGGGSLNLMRRLPHVGDVVQADDAERMEKLVTLIQAEIKRRKGLFSECGAMSVGAYREITGEQMPGLVLVLDNFAPVLNIYPQLEEFFIDLAREGCNYGVYWIVSANTPMSLTYRIEPNIRMKLALRMADSGDYSSIVGRTDGLKPEDLPGRGLVKGAPPLEFQTALPAEGKTDSERLRNLRELVLLMEKKWTGVRPIPVPVMPEEVTLSACAGKGIALGLDCETISPAAIELQTSPFVLVSEKGGNSRYVLVEAMLKQYLTYECQEVTVFDGSGKADAGCNVLRSGPEIDTYLAQLMPVMQKRKEQYQSEGGTFAPIVIVIPELKQCFDMISNDSAARLNLLVTLGRNLGVIVVAAGNADDIAMLYHGGDPFTMSMVKQGTAVVLGGNLRAHSIFQTGLSYTAQELMLNEHEAWLLSKETARRIKVISKH